MCLLVIEQVEQCSVQQFNLKSLRKFFEFVGFGHGSVGLYETTKFSSKMLFSPGPNQFMVFSAWYIFHAEVGELHTMLKLVGYVQQLFYFLYRLLLVVMFLGHIRN